MTKKLQIFVSSTYTDLIEERQAVVQAILMAGHIPAGMELFAAGDKSQLETIREWIKGSDVFVLILGGRYGSIEKDSGKSYIQLEYEYALEQNKPTFAAVISERYLDEKVRTHGKEAIETEHQEAYKSFKEIVLSKHCSFFDDKKDLKLIVLQSIPAVTSGRELAGWVRGDEILDPKKAFEQIVLLQSENARLTKQITLLEKKLSTDMYNGNSFEELLRILAKEQISVDGLPKFTEQKQLSLFYMLLIFADTFAVGIQNAAPMDACEEYLFFKLAPKLAIYGLTEKKSVNNRGIQRFQLSELGYRFLSKAKPLYQQAKAKVETSKLPALHPEMQKRPKSRLKN